MTVIMVQQRNIPTVSEIFRYIVHTYLINLEKMHSKQIVFFSLECWILLIEGICKKTLLSQQVIFSREKKAKRHLLINFYVLNFWARSIYEIRIQCPGRGTFYANNSIKAVSQNHDLGMEWFAQCKQFGGWLYICSIVRRSIFTT